MDDRTTPDAGIATGHPDLAARDQWVAWRYETRDDKQTKVPYNAATGRHADSTDPSTWSTFDVAHQSFSRGGYEGVGFVFSKDDPFFGVDLDHCRDAATGAVDPWAQEILDELDTYAELSPSGTGIHLWARGTLPSGARKRGKVEMYSEGRYFTVTGIHLEGTPATIEERTAQLAAIHARVFAPAKPVNGTTTNGHTNGANGAAKGLSNLASLSDFEIFEKASNAKNGAKFRALWHGDDSAHGGDTSVADLALCEMLAFWTNKDPDQVDRLFRQSGRMRPKWDTRHFGDGRTYGQGTIETAINRATETYDPVRQLRPSSGGNGASADAGASDTDRDGKSFALTDLGNAERFVDQHGEDARFCGPWGKWLAYDGARWSIDYRGQVERWSQDTARAIYDEALAAESASARQAIAKHAVKSESAGSLAAMVKIAQSHLPIVPDDLDRHDWLLNVQNGTIDLRTGELRAHRREDLITKLAPVAYDPRAEAPIWTAFLDRIMAGDHDLIAFLQRAAGYSLTGDVSEQVLFFLHGVGANGKSTFLKAILDALGDYGRQAAPELLIVKQGESHPTELADVAGVRFLSTIEVEEGKRMAEALVKQMTGGDRLKARRMREDFWEFEPTHKIWLAANHRPVIRGTDFAIWRRIRLIPFDVVIPEGERDRDLPAKLRTELPGILRWAVDGCLAWQRDGLGIPEKVREATQAYRADMDTLGDFLEDVCLLHPRTRATAGDLYTAYNEWCTENGEKPLDNRTFGAHLKERRLTRRKTNGKNYWLGIGLRATSTTPMEEGDSTLSTHSTHEHPTSGIAPGKNPMGLTGKLGAEGAMGAAINPTVVDFSPSDQWQEIPDGFPCPPGGEFRMDFATGKNHGRWANLAKTPDVAGEIEEGAIE